MKKYKILFFIICISTISFYAYTFYNNKKEINDLLDVITLSNDSIYSGKGSYVYKYKLVSEKRYNKLQEEAIKNDMKVGRDMHLTINYEFSNNKFKIDSYDEINNLNDMKSIYNGSEFKMISFQKDTNGLIHSVGRISEKIGLDMATYDPLFFASGYIKLCISLYKSKKMNIYSIKEEVYENTTYIVIDFRSDKRNFSEKYYIDPDYDYKVFLIKRELIDNDNKMPFITKIEYQSVNNMLFPRHVVHSSIQNGELIVVKEYIYNDDWQLNIDINADEFDLSFPKGIQVMNAITHEIYIEQ